MFQFNDWCSMVSILRKLQVCSRMMFRNQLRRLCLVMCLVFVVYAAVQLLWNSKEYDRINILQSIDKTIHANSGGRCKQPELPVHDPEMMKFVKDVPPITCRSAEKDWVRCEEQACWITEEAKSNYGSIDCGFVDVLRKDDFKLLEGKITYTNDKYILRASDVVKVFCDNHNSKTWSGILTGIRYDEGVRHSTSWATVPEDSLKLNVLMFGFDSLSRNTFIRKLPKSYKILTKVLEADILKGYNIVGDGTPQALIPILTGKTELELPETRKRMGSRAQHVNIYPWIWKDFKNYGYATAFLEDLPYAGTFTYRLKGFDEQPTDHYMRTYYVALHPELKRQPKLCVGSQPRHKVMLDVAKQFMSTYSDKPRFLFGFHGELSHDSYNLIGAADEDISDWLMDLHQSGALNNTLLIIMSDHGHRFAAIRNTLQGKQEERLPFFSFTLPAWFKSKHPNLYKHLKQNVDRLTTPFDIYPTLRSILYPNEAYKDLSARSLSLFSEIPESRTCSDAYIEPHWCACLNWQTVNTTSPVIKQAAVSFVQLLNAYTLKYRKLCEVLSLSSIVWAAKLAPHENLLRFHNAKDYDGFVPDMSAKTKVLNELYQIKVILHPGNSIFEASITHNSETDTFSIKLNDVSRINMYGKQARCVEKYLPQLRKYCYCRDSDI